MLKSARRLRDLAIHASDGDIGKVEDFYFDDETWAIRYLVVNSGSWLSGRLVLISPVFLRQVDWARRRLHIELTKKQIENSPDIDTHQPVSRQREAEYMDYFGSSYYWGGPDVWGDGRFPGDLAGTPIPGARTGTALAEKQSEDSHLRSTTGVSSYPIQATDGEIGHVEDFIVDADTWSIRYLEVNTRNWLPGKKVLVSPEWIEKVSWTEWKVAISLPRETIKNAPEYLESRPLTREYENQLHEYYNRLPYWIREAGHAHVPPK